MATTQTLATLTQENKTFYSKQLLARLLPNLVFYQLGQKKPMPTNEGDTVNFRRFNSLAVNTTALTEGAPPAGKSLSVTAITATVDQYGDFVQGSDKIDLLAIDPVLTETSRLLGEQAAKSIDTIVRDIVAAGTNVQYAGGVASRASVAAANTLSVAEIRKAVRTLRSADARPLASGDYVAVIHPKASYDLMGDTAWISANQYAGSTRIFNGEIGRLYGVRFLESTNAPIFTGAGAGGIDVYGTIIFGADAFGVIDVTGVENIVHPVGSAGTSDPLNQIWTSGWKVMFTAKILQDLAMVRVEHSVSA